MCGRGFIENKIVQTNSRNIKASTTRTCAKIWRDFCKASNKILIRNMWRYSL